MKIPISYLNDKKIVNIASSQVDFISYLVLPVYTEFSKLCYNLEPLIENLETNRKMWDSLKETFEIIKQSMNNQIINYEENDFESDFFSYENYQHRKQMFNPSY